MVAPLIGGVGPTELIVIALVVFVLFGATRIPAAFRSLGEGINSFKEGLEGKGTKGEEATKVATNAASPKPAENGGTSSKG